MSCIDLHTCSLTLHATTVLACWFACKRIRDFSKAYTNSQKVFNESFSVVVRESISVLNEWRELLLPSYMFNLIPFYNVIFFLFNSLLQCSFIGRRVGGSDVCCCIFTFSITQIVVIATFCEALICFSK